MNRLNQQQKNFLNLTAAYVSDAKPELENPDWNEIYKLSRIHSLSGVLYAVVQRDNLCDDEAVMNKLKKSFAATINNSARQEFALDKLMAMLNENNVKHIIYKGTVVRDYYPNRELRTMGDIDLIINDADRERVHELMVNAGALYDEVNSHSDVSNYKLNGVVFEIHTRIMSYNLLDDVDYKGYFADLFSHAEAVGDSCTYELKKEFHLIYLLAHMAKHFKFGGCGLRMYVDILMFMRRFEGKLDRNYMKAELDRIRLTNFADSVFQFCNRWFGAGIELFGNEVGDDAMDEITEYVIAGGTFGYHDKNVDIIRAGNKDNSWHSRIKTVLHFIFPSYEHLKRRYDWMKDMPRWMLPAAWIRYWFFRIFVVRKKDFKRIKQALGSSEDASKHYRLMNKIGLM